MNPFPITSRPTSYRFTGRTTLGNGCYTFIRRALLYVFFVLCLVLEIRFLIRSLSLPFIGHRDDPNRYHKRPRLHLPRLSEGRRPCVNRRPGDCRPASLVQRSTHPTSCDLTHAESCTSTFTQLFICNPIHPRGTSFSLPPARYAAWSLPPAITQTYSSFSTLSYPHAY